MEKPERLNLQSADGVQLNLDALYQIAPSCFTEALDAKTGEVKRKVDFNTLRQLLGDNAVEDAPEAYMFNWVGKQAARAEVLRPTKKTLRPVKEDSVDWDNTQNLYIEGDNLEVLKLLQKSYLGKVKMIYIDPPYNTGNDFVYHDDFAQTQAEYDEASGAVDELGNRYWKNTDSNGKYHSDWCSMVYSRLMVARSLLSEDGVIFVSIDNNEVKNAIALCNEIFAEKNCLGIIANINNPKGRSDDKFVATAHEYILAYAKNAEKTLWYGFEPTDDVIVKRYNKTDENSKKYREIDLRKTGEKDYREDRPNLFYYFYFNQLTGDLYPSREEQGKDGYIQILPLREDGSEGRWRWGLETSIQQLDQLIPKFMPSRKIWGIMQKDYLEGRSLVKPTSAWTFKDVNSERGTEDFINLGFDKRIFPKPKPIGTIKRSIILASKKDDEIILDFFSGSATTAHAVMQLNAEDGVKRKYIMVQLPEETPEDSEAKKSGYNTIPEIAKERIRRAGKKIKEEHPEAKNLDTGFRVFRLDESNYEDVEVSPKNLEQTQLDLFLNNIKSDRTDLDLLFGCMLSWGVQLSLPMTSEVVDGKTIYTVNDGDLVACFAENVTDDVVRAMANKMPLRVIFRDSCFAQDADKINIYETFKQLLDWSDQEVIKNIRVI